MRLWIVLLSLLALSCAEPLLGPADNSNDPPCDTAAECGAQLFQSKGCVNCHSVDGSGARKPELKGLFGSEVELSDGTKIIADDAYLTRSIKDPRADMPKGDFRDFMPKIQLSDSEISNLVAYIQSLK